ncbi:hypothetical protein QQ008_07885 [Fulvivirgaceae bacterium BMA10]|uniref:Uncharacterized protein n=1 Tax=Splendidivirga corallicola TaxID=3051826 RepID=A0ABT8KKN3_9BACT|nr:hypothetical protein [Fulvivirgaceae bacterium BMA10]
MPVYFILSKARLLKEEKEKLVKEVTDTHCTTTGAPSNLVTVLFLSGYRLKQGKKAMLLGNIRTGGNRTQEIIDRLGHGLMMAMANTLHEPVWKIGLQFLGVQSNYVWEGGQVLPPPGEELDGSSIRENDLQVSTYEKTNNKSFNN